LNSCGYGLGILHAVVSVPSDDDYFRRPRNSGKATRLLDSWAAALDAPTAAEPS
jgi:hypothetical protein